MTLRSALTKVTEVLQTLNNASRTSLLELPGLGKIRVDRILQKKEEITAARRTLSISDIVGIPGIGTAVFNKITGDTRASDAIKYALFYMGRFQNRSVLQIPEIVFSLDYGISNSAYALLDSSFVLRDWKKLELGLPKPYSPSICYQQVRQSLESFPTADAYILEEQSHRNPMNTGFLGISVELRTLEAMVFAILKNLKPDVPVQAILAKRIASYFDINASKSAVKKKASVSLVRALIDPDLADCVTTPMGNRLSVSDELVEFFEEEKKQDDLSDCLLQALAILEWSQMAHALSY